MTLAACAPTTPGAEPSGVTAATGSPGARREPSANRGDTDPECTKATKVSIDEEHSGNKDTFAFSPREVTVRRGGFLAVTNKSGVVHTLVTTPDARIVTSVIDLKERQVIQFSRSGTFTVQSADAAHRADLRVRVSGESGCGTPKATLTITGRSSFRPAKISVAATQNFTVVNESGTAQTVMCTPDPGGNRDNARLDKGEAQILAIDRPGRYVCASTQHPQAKATITVTGG
ncbi:hypothetical protein GCM10010168_50350 [Actinoplanes ianthinogenes]|uniref:Uncharacterized protein n=1 Tax=Actinoplanes ianthinogenes TaxID=122358 RepID=A0ABM7M358_9ACTN|nr:hypothetical protein Aiant_67440 [Actinoplanes ianthinogenes]GGR26124.1 hypothetical protein GCM10010168_50350 [Actinoplanes ianthinogenes]